MARVIHQEYYRDAVLGHIGMHQVQIISLTQGVDSFPIPPVSAPANAEIVGMTMAVTPVAASGTLTSSGQPANNDIIRVGDHDYTFKTNLTPAANEIHIGTNTTNTFLNLVAAIMGNNGTAASQAAGTGYGAATIANSMVNAAVTGGNGTTTAVTTFTAKIAGAFGNGIPFMSTTGGTFAVNGVTNGTFAGTTGLLSGGLGGSDPACVVVVGGTAGVLSVVNLLGFSVGDVVNVITYHGGSMGLNVALVEG